MKCLVTFNQNLTRNHPVFNLRVIGYQDNNFI
jgi:hypothetical protein